MKSDRYDYIIVGSGMGGSAAAYTLTQANKRVLLLESGGRVHHDDSDWDGQTILVEGRYKTNTSIDIKQYQQKKFKVQPQEEVLGGKTMFYGGACFRFREEDFTSWDLTYEDFKPWYLAAEQKLEIHGDLNADPCLANLNGSYPYKAIPYAPPAQRIVKAARKLKLKPFPIPLAINRFNPSRPQCELCNTCDGFPCKVKAKNDAVTCFLDRADTAMLDIKTHTMVDRIHINGIYASSLVAFDKKTKTFQKYKAPRIILSAGAIGSAGILLRSKVKDQSGLLGKRLMRHCNSIVGCLFPFKTNPNNVFHKQVAIMDYYHTHRSSTGLATGVIQDIYMPPAEVLPFFVPLGLKTVTKVLRGHIQNLLCITEDRPQLSNAISLSDDKDAFGILKTKVAHQYASSDVKRNKALVSKAKKILKKAGGTLSLVRKIDSFSHAVGTMKLGISPSTSVLDLNCRVHGLDNVFVLDGSFMPSSSGVNPSLTIAANALRVCHVLEGYGG